MKTDYGKDISAADMDRAYASGRCPRCGETTTDMRGTNASQFTLSELGKCYWNGEIYMGFACNQGKRKKESRA